MTANVQGNESKHTYIYIYMHSYLYIVLYIYVLQFAVSFTGYAPL